MAKLYSVNNQLQTNIPKKETVQFLLNYSKALYVAKTKNCNIAIVLN